MSGIPAFGLHATRGFLGVLGAWLKGQSSESRHAPEVRPSAAERPRAHSYGSVRLLVVDDNPVNLMMISALLESRDIVPVQAADGAEAVTLASAQPFDLILMDLQMPILDGLGATSAIRRNECDGSRSAVPVIAYSSMSPGAGVLAAHGMNGSLAKPCGDQELEDCLVQWCPTYRPAPPLRGVTHGAGGGWTATRSRGGRGELAPPAAGGHTAARFFGNVLK